MNIQAEKIELIRLITEIDSEKVLKKIKEILTSSKKTVETRQILANPAIAQRLEENRMQIKEDKGVKITLVDIISNDDKKTPEDEAILKAKRDINDLRILQKNWDDEGANPIDKTQIEKALSFVDSQFRFTSSIPSFIAPTIDSGVLIEFANNDKRIDVRFENHNPCMTIFKSGQLLYTGKVDQKEFRQHIQNKL